MLSLLLILPVKYAGENVQIEVSKFQHSFS